MLLKSSVFIIIAAVFAHSSKAQTPYQEPYRPQVHFTPKAKWMNDPNGMVYYKGTYNLFYQFYPNDIVWGPMHWGHATSTDLIHWKHLPIALYPDSLGYIFSGSAVADEHNTSGFGKNGKIPLVAIFTSHNPRLEKTDTNKVENESIAYSLDDGLTWTKYSGNPILKNPGIRDFRDPKVSWYQPGKKWLMTLATKDRITFYSSPNLKDWKKESEFGERAGAHGGVWECPDLFPLKLKGKTYYVLLVSSNPGGPNGGSGTQYFVGDFNGTTFTPISSLTKWIDFGPDDYAGVTWGNTGDRKIFLGWMSNWLYANQVPTEKWRSAMTIPRELSLKEIEGNIYLTSAPVTELNKIALPALKLTAATVLKPLSKVSPKLPYQYLMSFNTDELKDHTIILSNDSGEQMRISYHKAENNWIIDRSLSGNIGFNADFKKTSKASRATASKLGDVKLLVDAASVELFTDNGSCNMTAVFFAKKGFNHLNIKNKDGMILKNFKITPLRSIWK